MTFRVPSQDRRVSQPNSSDVNGNIYATRNIDFDEEGYIKLSSATVSLYSDADDADFDNVQSMFHGSSLHFLGGDVFKTGTLDLDISMTNVTATDTNPPSPGPEEDGVYFNDTEVVSDGSAVKYNVAGTWSQITGTQAPATGEPSVMEVFPAQNSLLFATGNKVNRINTSWTVAQTLTLPIDYIVTSIDVNGNYAYIGTRHQENGEAMLFLWTGVNTTNDGSFGVGTYEISTVKKYGSSVALVTSLGQLLAFNGSGFTELGAFPVYFTNLNWADASNDYAAVTNRGMVVDGDLIYVVINNEVQGIEQKYISNMPGSVWCYDPKVGLYHKHSATNSVVVKDTAVDTADINTTTDVITVTGITVPNTGAPVFYKDGGTVIGGLIDQNWYYTIKVTDTTFKLADTYENALNGVAIDLTSGSNFNDFMFINQKDYGAVRTNARNSILVLNNTEYNTKQLGRVVFSSDAPDTTGSDKWKLNVLCPKVRNMGYFVTPKMFASNTKDNFNSITLRFRPLKNGDKLVVKYRDSERLNMPAVARSSSDSDNLVTWTNDTTFTTVASPGFGTYDFSTVQQGDEVEIISGAAAGYIGVVDIISKSGFQYTVTLTESVPFVAASDTSTVQIDNWTVLETIDSTFEDVQKTIAADSASGWCQFKVIMEGTQVAVYDSVVDNKAYSRAR